MLQRWKILWATGNIEISMELVMETALPWSNLLFDVATLEKLATGNGQFVKSSTLTSSYYFYEAFPFELLRRSWRWRQEEESHWILKEIESKEVENVEKCWRKRQRCFRHFAQVSRSVYSFMIFWPLFLFFRVTIRFPFWRLKCEISIKIRWFFFLFFWFFSILLFSPLSLVYWSIGLQRFITFIVGFALLCSMLKAFDCTVKLAAVLNFPDFWLLRPQLSSISFDFKSDN